MNTISLKSFKKLIKIFYQKFFPNFLRIKIKSFISPQYKLKTHVGESVDIYFQACKKELENKNNNNFKNYFLHKAFKQNKVRSNLIEEKWWSDFIFLTTLPEGSKFQEINKSLISQIEYTGFNSLEYFEILHIYSLSLRFSLFELAYHLRKKSQKIALNYPTSIKKKESWKFKAKLSALLEKGNFSEFDKIIQEFKSPWEQEKYLLQYLRQILSKNKNTLINDMIMELDSKQDKNFRKFVEGKEIVIVGPIPVDLEDGHKIDKFDVVLRLNHKNNKTIIDSKRKGSRCEITYLNGSHTKEISKNGSLEWPTSIEWLSCKELSHAEEILKRLNLDEVNIKNLNIRGIQQVEPALFNGSLNNLVNVIMDLSRYNPKSIFLYHFDLMITKNRINNYLTKNVVNKNLTKLNLESFATHDPITQFIILKSFWERDYIKGDERFENIIKMSIEDYMKVLQKTYRDV